MTGSRVETAKGAALHSTLDYVRELHGDLVLARILADIDADVRSAIETCAPTGEVAYAYLALLWEHVDRALRDAAPHWIEHSGAHSIQSRGSQLYGGILRKNSPSEFLTQSVSLFRLFYQPGDMVVVEEGASRAVLRLCGFDAGTTLFCRRQTGGLACALEIAGGGEPTVTQVRCVSEGDAFCEWELTWQDARETEKRESSTRGLQLEP
ncbi:MAG: hypothetical protein ABIZ91_11985 [Gemmatimonadaceae bacterium]